MPSYDPALDGVYLVLVLFEHHHDLAALREKGCSQEPRDAGTDHDHVDALGELDEMEVIRL